MSSAVRAAGPAASAAPARPDRRGDRQKTPLHVFPHLQITMLVPGFSCRCLRRAIGGNEKKLMNQLLRFPSPY